MFLVPPNAGSVVLQVGDFQSADREDPDRPAEPLQRTSADKPSPTWRSPVDLAARFEKRVGPLVFNLDGARLEHFGDAVPPQAETLAVSFKIRVENAGQKYGAVVSADLFRLLVDGVPLAPTRSPVEAVAFQASLEGEVVFVMPGTATNVILQVGNIAIETAKVPVDLSAAH